MIKILLHGFFDPIPDLSPRTVSALALRAWADTVYSGWDQGWDQKTRVIIYISHPHTHDGFSYIVTWQQNPIKVKQPDISSSDSW